VRAIRIARALSIYGPCCSEDCWTAVAAELPVLAWGVDPATEVV